MMRIRMSLLTAFLVLDVGTLSAQLTGGVGGGYTRFVGEGSNAFKSGISLDGTILYMVNPNIHVGSRIAYHRWSPDEEVVGAGLSNFTSGGQVSSLELVPLLRIVTTKPGVVNFFAQSGAGYFRINVDTEFSAIFNGITYTLTLDETRESFGATFGGGLLLTKPNTFILFYPQLSLIFEGENTTKYFSLNVGFHFH